MASDDSKVRQAVAAWQQLLGADRVSAAPQGLDGFGDSTLAQAVPPAGVIRARSRDEVVEVVRVASEFGVPLYPISRGKNWGYGDACPVGPGQFVLDLSQMNRIVEVDPELAYAVVEPGVSQGQLHDHLEEQGYPLWNSCTGSSPDASVLGNLLERGFGMTAYSDHAAHACGMEVVLADGTILETGLGNYPNARSRHLYRWGLGPNLDGLFSQSNLGVVVRAGIWLMARPDAFTTFRLTMDRDADLEDAIDRLRRLRLEGTLSSPVFIANAFRSLAQMRPYPWAETGGATPLPRELAESMLRDTRVPGLTGRWNAIGSLHGTRRGMKAAARDTKAALRGLGRVYFTAPSTLDRFQRWGRLVSAIRPKRGREIAGMVEGARPGLDVFRGVPSHQGLGISRWRLRRKVEGRCEDPTAEGCGLYWVAPVCPAKGSEVLRCVKIIEENMLTRSFEPLIRIAAANDRVVFITTLLAFDREDAAEAARAGDCHRELVAKLLDEGYPPYRAGVTEMDLLDPNGSTHWEVVSTLKQALDPGAIFAPGRYEPRTAAGFRTVGGASSGR
jgi:4-cresol dehydrogenase (hydroxylating)